MTALDVLAMCRARGVELVADGGRIILRGPQAARDEVRPLVAGHKLELLAVLRSPATATPDRPGLTWQKDWRGQWVDLAGLHGGRDALPN